MAVVAATAVVELPKVGAAVKGVVVTIHQAMVEGSVEEEEEGDEVGDEVEEEGAEVTEGAGVEVDPEDATEGSHHVICG